MSYGTIRNYVSSLRIFYELHPIHVDLFHDFYISLTLRGIKRLHGYSPQAKLPITPQILTKLHSTIDVSSAMDLLFWAACLLAFFTFFRKSNLFLSSPSTLNPVRNLTRNDFQILSLFALMSTGQKPFSLVNAPFPYQSLEYQALFFALFKQFKTISHLYQCPYHLAYHSFFILLVLHYGLSLTPIFFSCYVKDLMPLVCNRTCIQAIASAAEAPPSHSSYTSLVN